MFSTTFIDPDEWLANTITINSTLVDLYNDHSEEIALLS